MEFKDYYAVLGVDRTASDADIKRAYRKLARQLHPDVNPGDKKSEARFKEINEANEVLSDSEKRRKYDELGANWRNYEQAGAQAGQPGSGFGGWSQGYGGAPGNAGGYRTVTPEEMEDAFGGGQHPFSDFFETFFGGSGRGASPGRSSRGRGPAKGRDVEHQLDLTLDEAFNGTSRRISTTRAGKERTVDVRIPAGVKEGARIRAAGEGGEGGGGGHPGDLYLIAHVLPHPTFERRGQDLAVRVDLPVTTAVLGGELSIPTLGGTPVRLKVPALTDTGRVFRLKGHGMPTVGKPDQRGDLYATVAVHIPGSLSEEQRRHYEALRDLDGRQK